MVHDKYLFSDSSPILQQKSTVYFFTPSYLDKESEAKSACKTQHLSNHVAISAFRRTLINHNYLMRIDTLCT